MNDSFQHLEPKENLPKHLKEEVFNTLDTLHLMADVVNLFTVDYVASEMELLDLLSSEPEEED